MSHPSNQSGAVSGHAAPVQKGRKVLILPCEFRYTAKAPGGQATFLTEHAVTVCAPSLAHFAIHSRMIGFAKAASATFQREQAIAFSAMKPEAIETMMRARKAMAADAAQAGVVEAEELPPETEVEMADRVMDYFATGLGPDRFPEFWDWLKKVLTGNPRLAFVGDAEGGRTGSALNDGEWNAIDQAGGMEAINIILAGFADFFLTGVAPSKSASTTGTESPTSQPSEVTEL